MGDKGTFNTPDDSQSLKKHIEAVHSKIKRVCPLCGATVTSLAGHMSAVHAGMMFYKIPGVYNVAYFPHAPGKGEFD